MERQKKQRNPFMLFTGLTGLIGLSAYVNIVPPDSFMSLTGFFLLFIIAVTALLFYVMQHMRHAMLISAGMTIYLILRLLGLRQPLYAVLLLASIIALEYLWKDQGQP